MKIYKYPIQLQDEQKISMPAFSEAIYAGRDPKGAVCIWAKVDPAIPPLDYTVYIRGTGHEMGKAEKAKYIGSLVEGPFVWHVFFGA